ncbi:chaperonin 10-like protein [Bombardia bombarda]|uniref:Chaperonin 10-like protein n=1 Tax=Bombardia bombarda TaxID=252184 RepID=A0AA40C5H2_9PEZI|nr:chaperonin 10-like protein [Bombardia bombarda]
MATSTTIPETMKEAVISKGTIVKIITSPTPTLTSPDQLLIRVVFSGSNPKDWKLPEWPHVRPRPSNEGDDIAGEVVAAGANVYEFQPGDRVAAFHEMGAPGGSFAEYAVAYAHATFHLPRTTSFEQGAAIPLAAMTAAIGLHRRLGLPLPWQALPEGKEYHDIPLVIYGAGSAVGYYATQLALRANIHPLILVAGGSAEKSLVPIIEKEKGDVIVDYRGGDAAVVEGIKAAIPAGRQLLHAFDAVSEKGSPENLGQVVGKGGKVTFVLMGEMAGLGEGVEQSTTMVGGVHNGGEKGKDFAFVFFRLFGKGLQEGWFRPQKTRVREGAWGVCSRR